MIVLQQFHLLCSTRGEMISSRGLGGDEEKLQSNSLSLDGTLIKRTHLHRPGLQTRSQMFYHCRPIQLLQIIIVPSRQCRSDKRTHKISLRPAPGCLVLAPSLWGLSICRLLRVAEAAHCGVLASCIMTQQQARDHPLSGQHRPLYRKRNPSEELSLLLR